jgi:hydrogenase maturation factor
MLGKDIKVGDKFFLVHDGIMCIGEIYKVLEMASKVRFHFNWILDPGNVCSKRYSSFVDVGKFMLVHYKDDKTLTTMDENEALEFLQEQLQNEIYNN